MYDHAEPMHAPNIAKFGRQILLALKALRAAGIPSMRGHLHTGNVLISEQAFPLSIGISGEPHSASHASPFHFHPSVDIMRFSFYQISKMSSSASHPLVACFSTRA